MTLRPEEQDSIRHYLLGELDDEARRRVEERLLTDDQFFEELCVIEDELTEEYAGGMLEQRAKERFESHFLCTPERRRKLRFSRALTRYVSERPVPQEAPVVPLPAPARVPWMRSFFNSYAGLAVAALVLLTVGFGVWRVFFYQSDVSQGLVALKSAYREQRPLEERISDFDYAPLVTTRGPNDQSKVDYRSRDRAERILLDAVGSDGSAASRHALGRLYLAEQRFDQAVEQFEEALKTDPRNAQLHSDLGVALLEKGKAARFNAEAGTASAQLAKSLEQFNRALELNGSLHEALFNRALAYQHMMMPQQAADAWRQYLEKDPNSQWAQEARQHLRLIEEQQKTKGALDLERPPRAPLSA